MALFFNLASHRELWDITASTTSAPVSINLTSLDPSFTRGDILKMTLMAMGNLAVCQLTIGSSFDFNSINKGHFYVGETKTGTMYVRGDGSDDIYLHAIGLSTGTRRLTIYIEKAENDFEKRIHTGIWSGA